MFLVLSPLTSLACRRPVLIVMKLLLVYVFFLVIISVSSAGLNLEFTWTRINYEWPSNRQRIRRSDQGNPRYGKRSYHQHRETVVIEDPNYVVKPLFGKSEEDLKTMHDETRTNIDYQYENNIPMSVNAWKNKLFITVPRRRLGIPSTLNYVSLDNPIRHNTPLIPYPNWKKNLYPDPQNTGQNFLSVYRVAVDPCDRLWFVDTGVLELPGNATKVKPPTLVIMDLNTDQVIHTFQIPADSLKPKTSLTSISVDVTENTCGDAYAYITDLGAFGLVVYSLKNNKSWRVNHRYFNPDPNLANFFVSGHSFKFNDGIFSTELSSLKQNGYRDLYFHPLAGTHMYKVSTLLLRNETESNRSSDGTDFQNIGDRGPQSQSTAAYIHQPSGVMFLGLINQNALACWNTNLPLNTISIVQKDNKTMAYPSDVKVHDDKVYLITNSMPQFLFGKLDYDTINFRVWSNNVEDAIAGTRCATK
ncbi:L-dopachrome tautomerase yellow-f2 [Leptinotarsa decemlineata]|uniref:L-dopachrome tautomerase yellow-f2 n=1 Tax=Leptinotarsa decemlineata TaxID=7539 RepID=UPI003D30CD5A